MTLSEIAIMRLQNQQLAKTDLKSAVEMIEWFAAMQGQEYAQTKWGIGLRLPFLTDLEIEADLQEGRILRTHLLRPTWHFVSAKDIGWLLNLTAPRVHQANAYMYRQLALDNNFFKRCNDILIKNLRGGKHLTRDEINEEFKKENLIAKGHRLSYIMMQAELEGIICSGARQGNQFTYALLDERISLQKVFDKDKALAQLTTRYFNSRGPATVKDFATWSGLTISHCKRGIEMIKSLLKMDIVEQQEYYYKPADSLTDTQVDRIVFLPVYDEYILGYKDRRAIMTLKGNAPFRYDCMIVCNGQVIGTWRRSVLKKKVELEHKLFKPLSTRQGKQFDEAINHYSQFMNLKIDLK